MAGRPPVCKFYKQGNCQYGNNCRFYHPEEVNNYRNNNTYNNSNPFGGNFNSFNKGNSPLGAFDKSSSSAQEDVHQFCNPSTIGQRETEIRNDMNELSDILQLSNNIFTSYSLKPPASVNLIANRDLSFEETRVQYYLARSTNSVPPYEQQLTNRFNDMKSCITFLRNNTQKAVRYLQLALQNSNTTPKPLIPPFDADASANPVSGTSGNSIFGSTNTSNPFGGSGFNQSPFGSNSANSPFGNVAGTSGSFGTVTSSNKSNPFGGASNPFGSSSASTGAFGSSGFSTKSNGGAFSSQVSPFGNHPSSRNTGASVNSGFGNSGFGSSGFGSSGFGTSATASTVSSDSNPFGASSKVSNPFGGTATTVPATTTTSISTPFGNIGKGSESNSLGSTSFGSTGFGNTGFGNIGFGSTGFGNSSTYGTFGKSSLNTNTPDNIANASDHQQISQVHITGGNDSLAFGSNPFGSNTNAFHFDGSSITSQPVVFYKQGGIDDPPTLLKDLGEEVVQRFKSEKFELGKVPDIPPPLELC